MAASLEAFRDVCNRLDPVTPDPACGYHRN